MSAIHGGAISLAVNMWREGDGEKKALYSSDGIHSFDIH